VPYRSVFLWTSPVLSAHFTSAPSGAIKVSGARPVVGPRRGNVPRTIAFTASRLFSYGLSRLGGRRGVRRLCRPPGWFAGLRQSPTVSRHRGYCFVWGALHGPALRLHLLSHSDQRQQGRLRFLEPDFHRPRCHGCRSAVRAAIGLFLESPRKCCVANNIECCRAHASRLRAQGGRLRTPSASCAIRIPSTSACGCSAPLRSASPGGNDTIGVGSSSRNGYLTPITCRAACFNYSRSESEPGWFHTTAVRSHSAASPANRNDIGSSCSRCDDCRPRIFYIFPGGPAGCRSAHSFTATRSPAGSAGSRSQLAVQLGAAPANGSPAKLGRSFWRLRLRAL